LSGETPVTSSLVKPDIPIVAARKAPAQTLDDVLASRQQPSEIAESKDNISKDDFSKDRASKNDSIEDLDRELAAHFDEEDLIDDVAAAHVDTSTNSVESAAASENLVEAQLESAIAESSENAPVELDTSRTREERSADRVDSLQVGNWVEFQQGAGK